MMNQRLVTHEQRKALVAIGRKRVSDQHVDPQSVVRLFAPDAGASWLLASLDPGDQDTAYGLCDVGVGLPELGHVKLSELASIVGPRGRPILRDRYFRPMRPRVNMPAWRRQAVPSLID